MQTISFTTHILTSDVYPMSLPSLHTGWTQYCVCKQTSKYVSMFKENCLFKLLLCYCFKLFYLTTWCQGYNWTFLTTFEITFIVHLKNSLPCLVWFNGFSGHSITRVTIQLFFDIQYYYIGPKITRRKSVFLLWKPQTCLTNHCYANINFCLLNLYIRVFVFCFCRWLKSGSITVLKGNCYLFLDLFMLFYYS